MVATGHCIRAQLPSVMGRLKIKPLAQSRTYPPGTSLTWLVCPSIKIVGDPLE